MYYSYAFIKINHEPKGLTKAMVPKICTKPPQGATRSGSSRSELTGVPWDGFIFRGNTVILDIC